jgi:hypothetical protein
MKVVLFMVIVTCLLTGCDDRDATICYSLKGHWTWKSTCGGVVGCVFASGTTYRTLKITDSTMEIVDNGLVTFQSEYSVQNVTDQDNAKLYQIELDDGIVWMVTISDNNLITDYASVIYSVYEREK